MIISECVENLRYEAYLAGNFTYEDNTTFRDFIKRVESHDVNQIILDFSQIQYIDSSGLGMLLLLHKATAEKGVSITLRGSKDHTHKMFSLTHFDTLFHLE